MKRASRKILTINGLALLVAFGFALTAQAQVQNREKYLISAKAGGINLVSGNVMVERQGDDRWRKLTVKDDLESGDRVATGAFGRVEVLLNPGTYMRVHENSEFELTDASLDDLRVTLVKGSAVVEVSSADGVRPSIGINTPQTEALIIRGGIYRFNVLAADTTEIIVRKGRVLYGKGAPNEVKGGRKVIIRSNSVAEIAKLDKKDQDFLDLWSEERARALAQANQRLQRRTLMTAFNDFGWNDYGGYRHGGYGFWIYSASAGGYCFLPFGLRGWSSPYGHRYGNGGYAYYGPLYGNPTSGSSGNPPTGNNGNNGGGNNGGGNNGGGNGNPSPGPPSQPTYQPPPQPMPAPRHDAPIERPTREHTIQPGSPQR